MERSPSGGREGKDATAGRLPTCWCCMLARALQTTHPALVIDYGATALNTLGRRHEHHPAAFPLTTRDCSQGAQRELA